MKGKISSQAYLQDLHAMQRRLTKICCFYQAQEGIDVSGVLTVMTLGM